MKKRQSQLIVYVLCTIFILTFLFPCKVSATATKLKLNWKNNQIFYILPTNYKTVSFQARIMAGGDPSDLTCLSDNPSVATIDNTGLITFHDGGSANITVTSQGKNVRQTIKVLNRTDWSKVVTVNNFSQLKVKNNVCTIKMTNQMDFPVKMAFKYDTYNKYNTKISSNITNESIYLAANATVTYQKMMEDEISYIAITDATFDYNQYGTKNIVAKKVTVKETDSASKYSKEVRVKKATVTNNNKYDVIVPYQTYFYDKKDKLENISYGYLMVSGGKRSSIKFTYSPKGKQEKFVKKVKYKFHTAMPVF